MFLCTERCVFSVHQAVTVFSDGSGCFRVFLGVFTENRTPKSQNRTVSEHDYIKTRTTGRKWTNCWQPMNSCPYLYQTAKHLVGTVRVKLYQTELVRDFDICTTIGRGTDSNTVRRIGTCFLLFRADSGYLKAFDFLRDPTSSPQLACHGDTHWAQHPTRTGRTCHGMLMVGLLLISRVIRAVDHIVGKLLQGIMACRMV